MDELKIFSTDESDSAREQGQSESFLRDEKIDLVFAAEIEPPLLVPTQVSEQIGRNFISDQIADDIRQIQNEGGMSYFFL